MISPFNKLIMKKDTLEYRMMQEHNRLKIHESRLIMGSTKDKFPVILDGGRTIIYISDKSRESEIREKYEMRRSSSVMVLTKKPKS